MTGTQTAPETDLLLQHFSGKRRWERIVCTRDARVSGDEGDYRVRTLDLSGGGTSLEIVDPAFYLNGDGDLDAFHRVQASLPGDLRVSFPVEQVTVGIRVVRLTAKEDGHLCLGCEFERDLTDAELVLLGIPVEGVTDADLYGPLYRHSRPAAPLSVIVFGVSEEVAGPLLIGAASGQGASLIEVRLPHGTDRMREVAELIAGTPLVVVLQRGTRQLWSGAARLVSCRALVPGEPVTIRLRLDDEPGRAVRRHFRRT